VLAKDDYILDILINGGIINPTDAETARADAAANGHSAVDELVNHGLVTHLEVLRALANDAGLPVQESIESVPDDAIAAIPGNLAARYGVMPLHIDSHSRNLRLAISNPYDFETVDTLHNLLKFDIESIVVPRDEIVEAIKRY
jgi:hypothetical protein